MLDNTNTLKKLVTARMPFGKYKGRLLFDLPAAYLIWFEKTGFPSGAIGEQLVLMYQLKMDGNGDILRQLHKQLSAHSAQAD
ncbi:DUF3820 family protein [Echinimonas agarilytica]|uniref:DUF3820 family protein n=1 Tax=Echinimonas agarilytica TaxID=1215918 RepID=A0AA41W789_9GAMM|nr:DUF3820 family protein [Echinimonas agarilytica]MCM2679724.1 DUF3820 family protein [Echinimonas agarilytica]